MVELTNHELNVIDVANEDNVLIVNLVYRCYDNEIIERLRKDLEKVWKRKVVMINCFKIIK